MYTFCICDIDVTKTRRNCEEKRCCLCVSLGSVIATKKDTNAICVWTDSVMQQRHFLFLLPIFIYRINSLVPIDAYMRQ